MRTAFLTVLAAALLAGCGSAPDERAGQAPVVRPERAEIRAYHGAPPVIPHEVEALGRENCMACHGPGQQASGLVIAPVTPHPEWTQCNQCHVPALAEGVFAANTLKALEEPVRVDMPGPFLPPYIPHRVDNFREQSCETCHIGVQAAPELRPSHGPRVNCTQCHVPAYYPQSGYGVAPSPFEPSRR